MSMTSLQAQLAALNGAAGNHPGSTFASSRRHEDAIGRGLHFRPEHGHAITDTIRFKASFIYPTAEEAAKAPLRILEENGKEAARNLSKLEPSLVDDFALVFSKSEVEASSETLELVLIQISTLLGEKDDAVVENCLHVLEYMLRRYNLHLTMWEDLVWCFLPHHEKRSSLLHRCLQLVDLASNQSYLFLRPYADPKNSASIPRSLLTRHIIKEPNLLRRLVHLVREASLWVDEASERSEMVRYGLSYFLSWTAACTVEGLSWQRKQPPRVVSDDHRESMLRILLPIVKHCCKSTQEARSWGHIVASAASETMELGDSVLMQWTSTILEYADDENAAEDYQDAFTAILSILVPPHSGNQVVDQESYFPLLMGKWLGCPLPVSTFDIALQKDSTVVARVLGELHQEVQISHLFAAFVARAVHKQNHEFLLTLLQEPKLESLWKQSKLELVSSLSAWVVTLAAAKGNDTASASNNCILKGLHRFDPTGAEQGFAHALQEETTPEGKNRIVSILETVVAPESLRKDNQVALPRVALDDVDESTRLKAIESLLATVEKADLRTRKSLLDLFMKRWQQETDLSVATALGEGVVQLLSSPLAVDFHIDHPQMLLEGFYLRVQTEGIGELLALSLQMIKAALGGIACNEQEKQLLVEACMSCLIKKRSKNITKHALRAIGVSYGLEEGIVSETKIAELVSKDALLLSVVQKGMAEENGDSLRPAEAICRRQCALSVLSLFGEHSNFISDETTSQYCLELATTLLGSQGGSFFTSEDLNKIKICLEVCSPFLSQPSLLTSTIVQLSSMADEFQESVAFPVLQMVLTKATDVNGSQLSAVSVLFEASLDSNIPTSIACRLIEHAARYATKRKSPSESFAGVVPALSLLDSEDDQIRLTAFSFLESIGKCYGDASSDWTSCAKLKGLRPVYKLFSTFTPMSEASRYESLTTIMSNCVKHSKTNESRRALLLLCNLTCRALSTSDVLSGETVVPPEEQSLQSINATTTVLKAMELCGEDDYPILERWKVVGMKVVGEILEKTDSIEIERVSPLLTTVIKMLKGRYVANAKVVFSSGPQKAGGRTRSYSLGSIAEAKTVTEYPVQMSETIVNILSSRTAGALVLASAVFDGLFMEKSWSEDVFLKLDTKTRTKLFVALCKLVEEDLSEAATAVFVQVPFECSDLLGPFQDWMKDDLPNIKSLLPYTRFVSSNSERLGGSDQGPDLLKSLLKVLVKVAPLSQSYDDQDFEFSCQSLVNSLKHLCEFTKLPMESTSPILRSLPVLLSLQGASADKSIQAFSTTKHQLSSLSLIATFASQYPKESRNILLVSMKYALANNTISCLGKKHRVEYLSNVFGSFWQNSDPDHVEFKDILFVMAEFIVKGKDESNNALLLPDIAAALKITSAQEATLSSVGSLTCTAAAIQLRGGDENCNDAIKDIIYYAPRATKIPSIVLVFQYIKNLIVELWQGETGSIDEIAHPLPSHKDIISARTAENKHEAMDIDLEVNREFVLALIQKLGTVLRDCLRMEDVLGIVGKVKGDDAERCLLLWQGTLWLHAVSESLSIESSIEDEKSSWLEFTAIMDEVRREFQSAMPVSLFLASVSSLLEEDSRSEMLPQALTLLAERVSEVTPASPEASLFLGILPKLCEFIGGSDVWSSITTASNQAALLAAEHIGRMLFLDAMETENDATGSIVELLVQIGEMFETGAQAMNLDSQKFCDLQTPQIELICSLALASSTFIKIAGVKSLPCVSKILAPVVRAMALANGVELDKKRTHGTVEPKTVQLAAVRTITAFLECVPQFLGPYLHILFSDTTLLSQSLRSETNHILHQAVTEVDTSLSRGVPARLLVPALVKALENSHSFDNVLVMITILQRSVEDISPREAGALKTGIFSFVTKALDFDDGADINHLLLKNTNDLLISFVLKLSETQLRTIYLALREWKGQSGPDESNLKRRFAFWAISAALSGQLQSLFLPCISSVVGDLENELKHAIDLLCNTTAEKLGRKKRKLSVGDKVAYPGCAPVAQQMLLCLERSLRASAREGGNWIRAEENKRFNIFLGATKLLQCNIDPSTTPSYEEFVEGDSGEGNVVGCLIALALAAGDEQLWKPLNHAVLEAAGTDSRVEVRKAGLVTLFSLMKSLGEEYMVLLPECLPVLSELLEDSNEEVAGLSRDIITYAEELLGESLEDTLR